jgi:hypothetical protein
MSVGYKVSFENISNRAAWAEQLQLGENDVFPAISEAVLEIDGNRAPSFHKTLTGGDLDYDDETGILEWNFSDTVMRTFSVGTYKIGLVLTISGADIQQFVGTITIEDGVVA